MNPNTEASACVRLSEHRRGSYPALIARVADETRRVLHSAQVVRLNLMAVSVADAEAAARPSVPEAPVEFASHLGDHILAPITGLSEALRSFIFNWEVVVCTRLTLAVYKGPDKGHITLPNFVIDLVTEKTPWCLDCQRFEIRCLNNKHASAVGVRR